MRKDVFKRIEKEGVLPVVAIPCLDAAVPLARAIVKGGIHAMEVTLRTPCALEAIAAIRKAVPAMAIGAGTVLRTDQIALAMKAGADFLVAPGFDPDIVRAAQDVRMPIVPGVVNPTEITAAVKMGLRLLKFFPSEANGGLPVLTLLHGPFPGVKFVPTGGMTMQNIGSYLARDFVAACGGSYMAKSADVKAGAWDKIAAACARSADIARRARVPERGGMVFPRQKRLSTFVGFGDFLLRLSPPGYRRFSQASSFETYYTGAEANVCASLAVMGARSRFVTRIPDNPIAETGLGELRRLQVDVSHVVRGGDRLGLYYVEKGASQRPSKVVYDRMNSGVTTASRRDFDWEGIMKGASHFHFTGITPALGGELPAIVADACRAAKKARAMVSCDLNYRKNLWSPQEAKLVMTKLLTQVDYLIANEEDAEKVLGIKADDTDVTGGRLSLDGYVDVARRIVVAFPNIRVVAVTLRRSISASDNVWGAMLYAGGKAFFSRDYNVHIVDRVGGGDSFAAGLVYALGSGYGPQEVIEFAVAASCLKHSIELDVNLSTLDEVKRLASGDGSGRVQR